MVTGVPEEVYPYLVPVLILEDGTKVAPIVYMKNIEYLSKEDIVQVSYSQDTLCIISEEENPSPAKGIRSETVYIWKQGEITRKDTFFIDSQVRVKKVEMECLTFSEKVEETTFGFYALKGGIREMLALGYDSHTVKAVEDEKCFYTPDGAIKYDCKWQCTEPSQEKINVSWTMKY